MAQLDWQGYIKLMEGLAKTLGQLAQVERDKTDAVSRGDLPAVEEQMKREQVMSLSLRGYDQKREAMLKALGMPGATLRRLEEHAPEEHYLAVKAASEELRRQYAIFQAASQAARTALEVNLRAIERVQAQQAGDSAQAEEERRIHQTDFRA